MKTKTDELTGAPLDWAVAQCVGAPGQYSTDWALGGPIIEREQITLEPYEDRYGDIDEWLASHTTVYLPCTPVSRTVIGPTPLIAAMRCYVASKLGDEVGIPDTALQGANND